MDIAKKLQEYDEAFDFYMDKGRLPETLPQGDVLGGFLSQTINDNPQLESQDPLWKDVLKEETMKFIEAMLKIFQPIEQQHKQEKGFILTFSYGSIEKKREMWGKVMQTVKSEYKPEQVNIDGYVEQMKTQNTETVLASFVKDWNKACDERKERLEKDSVERNRKRWELHVKERGLADYNILKNIEKTVYSYPALVEIIRIMGREQPKRDDELDNTVRKYLPILPTSPKPAVEIDEITIGNSLRHMMPIETAIMSDHQTVALFYLKYATQRLQLFANKPKEESRMKIDEQKELKPRYEKGPIIVSVDTSGSMSGKPIELAKCLLLQLLKMAKKQKRKCYLITFSVRARYLDLSQHGSWTKLNKFLDDFFTGGTDGEEMLNAALKMLHTEDFAMADVLIISDFYFEEPLKATRIKMNKEHDKGTRFYGLQIDSASRFYNDVLDKIWKVQIKNSLFSG